MDMITDAQLVAQHEAVRAQTHAGGEFLTFRLGAEEYGIDILRVQEIRSYEQPIRIANAPHFIKGVVNLRGVIVLNVKGRVVDSVSDVLELHANAIKPAPEMSSAIDASYITGIGAIKSGSGDDASERMLILMDIEAPMASADMGLMDTAA